MSVNNNPIYAAVQTIQSITSSVKKDKDFLKDNQRVERLQQAVGELATIGLSKTLNAKELTNVQNNLKYLDSALRAIDPKDKRASDVALTAISLSVPKQTLPKEQSNITTLQQQVGLLLRDLNTQHIPPQIAGHPGFHAHALDLGIRTIQHALKENPQEGKKVQEELQKFAMEYAKEVLNASKDKKCFIVRPSSVLPHDDIKSIFTISRKYPTKSEDGKTTTLEIGHTRIYEIQKEGKTQWHINDPKGEKTGYDSFSAAVRKFGGKPVEAPSAEVTKKVLAGCGYTASKDLEGEAATEAQKKDPIAKLLLDRSDPENPTLLEKPVTDKDGNTRSLHTLDSKEASGFRNNLLAAKLLDVRLGRLAGDRPIAQKEEQKIAQNFQLNWKNDSILREFEDPLKSDRMMQDPVLAPNNVTYDRKTLLEHLKKNGNKLPDGTACTPNDLYPNKAAKAVLEARVAELKERNK